MKLRIIRDWERRWRFRPVRDTAGYIRENTYDILRNGVVVGRVQKEWGGQWSWDVYTSPKERGWANTMTEALHDARNYLGLRRVKPPHGG